jgi:small-conductance mechanosensitive channel
MTGEAAEQIISQQRKRIDVLNQQLADEQERFILEKGEIVDKAMDVATDRNNLRESNRVMREDNTAWRVRADIDKEQIDQLSESNRVMRDAMKQSIGAINEFRAMSARDNLKAALAIADGNDDGVK